MKEGDPYKLRGSRFLGGDKCGIDGKTHLFYIRLSGWFQTKELMWFEPPSFGKMELTKSTFVVPVLQGVIYAI